jgi:hypothetical protein
MFKRNITWIGISVPGIIILLTFWYIFNNQRFEELDPVAAVPQDAALVIQVNAPGRLLSSLFSDNGYATDLSLFDSYKTLKNVSAFLDTATVFSAHPLDAIKKRPFILSYHPDTLEHLTSWIINTTINTRTEYKELSRLLEALPKEVVRHKKNNGKVIHIQKGFKIPVSLYVLLQNGIISISNSPRLLEISSEQRQNGSSLLDDATFKQILKTSFASNAASVYINYKQMPEFTQGLFSAGFLDKVSDWSELDLELRQDAIFLNGFSIGKQEHHFISLFKGVEPRRNEIYAVLPASAKFVMSFTFPTESRFKENLVEFVKQGKNSNVISNLSTAFEERQTLPFAETFFSFLNSEFALVYSDIPGQQTNSHKALVFNTIGQARTLEVVTDMMLRSGQTTEPAQWIMLDDQTKYPVYRTPEIQMFQSFWGNLFPEIPSTYFSFYRNYIVFANSVSSIEHFIYTNVLNKTLSTHPYFSPFLENFSYQENFFLFCEIPFISRFAEGKMNRTLFNPTNEQNRVLANFYGAGVQMSSTGNMVYTSIHANHAPHRDKEPRTIWQSRLDSIIIGKPALVDNHITGEKEILVQDSKNNIYLLNNMGRILWKRQLDGAILGDIHQIDYYKNNKIQYLFNTAGRIYLLDRNGNHVARYPYVLSSKATNGLSVFDYDNDKDYRIFIALEDKRVYLYDKTGNRNPGWSLPLTEGTVIDPVQRFQVQGRDYILFSDQFRNYILDRRGETRITPSRSFVRNQGSLFYLEAENAENPKFVTTTQNGELAKIAIPSGECSIVQIPDVGGRHHFILLPDSRPNAEYAITTEQSLRLLNSKGHLMEKVDFENPIQLNADVYRFSATDIKLGVVDKSGGRIHLINKDGSLYSGFPLKGTSRFSIGFLKSSAYRFNLITGGDHNYLYNYRVE